MIHHFASQDHPLPLSDALIDTISIETQGVGLNLDKGYSGD